MKVTTSSQEDMTAKRSHHLHRPQRTRASVRPTGQTLTVSVVLPQGAEVDTEKATELLALALVSSGQLSQSQAAQVLDISRYDLIELMGTHGLPIVRLNERETETEQRHLRELAALRDTHRTKRPAKPDNRPVPAKVGAKSKDGVKAARP